MTVQNPITAGLQRSQQIMHRRQVRYFALVWTAITLLIGACTFAVVYAATGLAGRTEAKGLQPSNFAANSTINQTNNTNNDAALSLLVVTATPFPTFAPTTGAEASPTPVPAAAGPTPTIPASKDTDFDLGIAVQTNPDANTYKLWVEMAGKQLKLNWVKSQLVWRDVEKAKGQYEWGELDVELNLISQAGMKVLLSIVKAPAWARDPGAKIQDNVTDGPPANPKDYADFLTALLTRYAGKVQAIEVWNETNIDREWATNPPAINAARYVELLKTAYTTIKAIDPSIVVSSAGLAPTGANIAGAATDDFVYMDQFIAAQGLQYLDCVGAHANGYNVPPTADWNNVPERNPRATFRGPWENPHHSWSFKSTLEGYAQRIKAAGSSAKLCVTEFGWPSIEDLQGKGQLRDGFGFASDNTLQDQSDFTVQAINMMEQGGIVRLAFLWNLNYGAQAGWQIGGAVGDNVPWSILGPDYKPRPVWQRIVDMNFSARPRKAS